MRNRLAQNAATYGPQEHKTFAGALGAFFQKECPQLSGEMTRRVLVEAILKMVEVYYPETTHLKAGQIQWVTVHREEKASYAKKMSDTRLTSVTLDLVRLEDARERAQGRKLRDIKKEAAARLFKQAYEQEGCLTSAEMAILLKISMPTVTKYAKEWEAEHNELLPRRGTVHDMGPTLTHKREIVEKLFLEGKSVEQVMRETHHSAEAVHRYIVAFKQVLLCRRKGLSCTETAFATKMSPRLVGEYNELIDNLASKNKGLDEMINTNLGRLLQARKEAAKN
jgi:hypothetical protein